MQIDTFGALGALSLFGALGGLGAFGVLAAFGALVDNAGAGVAGA